MDIDCATLGSSELGPPFSRSYRLTSHFEYDHWAGVTSNTTTYVLA